MITRIFPLLTIVFISLTACNNDDDGGDDVASKAEVSFSFELAYDGQPLQLNTNYKDQHGNDFNVTTFNYYVGNIRLKKADGSETLLKDIVFENYSDSTSNNTYSAMVTEGSYSSVLFDFGVPPELNGEDPATYAQEHPLSITNNMYWTWATMYIFIKSEGFVSNDTVSDSWFIHTGLDEMLAANEERAMEFTLTATGKKLVFKLDMKDALAGPTAIDLLADGKSHTMDNMPLAAAWQNNLAKAMMVE